VKEDVERAKKLLDEAGWKVGADGIREKDGIKLAPKVYFTANANSARVAEAIQGYLRKIGIDWRLHPWDSTIAAAKMAEQDYEIWSVTVPYLSAGDLMSIYFDFAEHPDAEPDELEGCSDRRMAGQGQGGAQRRRPRQVLWAGAGPGDERAPLDAGAEHQHGHGRVERRSRTRGRT
jgi:ABC-type transport system substrate-binding protein